MVPAANRRRPDPFLPQSPTSEFEREGGACPLCRAPAYERACWQCCDTVWIIDCPHMLGPRPIVNGRSDGSDGHRLFCDECARAPR
jgi:hypothetical protein